MKNVLIMLACALAMACGASEDTGPRRHYRIERHIDGTRRVVSNADTGEILSERWEDDAEHVDKWTLARGYGTDNDTARDGSSNASKCFAPGSDYRCVIPPNKNASWRLYNTPGADWGNPGSADVFNGVGAALQLVRSQTNFNNYYTTSSNPTWKLYLHNTSFGSAIAYAEFDEGNWLGNQDGRGFYVMENIELHFSTWENATTWNFCDAQPGNIWNDAEDIAWTVAVHELGHVMGLEHNQAGSMYGGAFPCSDAFPGGKSTYWYTPKEEDAINGYGTGGSSITTVYTGLEYESYN